MEFEVPAMSCGHCVKAITQTLTELDPTAQVSIDLPGKKVTVQTAQDREKVAAALAEAGYPTA
ncbi:MAG: heavy-metal-associated domain-containing protein [Pseudomonadota bacterium]|nr:heavy-metal-associated domain-containing protein [Pseudomonadota bacterium]